MAKGFRKRVKNKTVITIAVVVIMAALMVPIAGSESKPLKWYSFDEGVALGKSQGKKVFIHFWAEWCTYCHTMERETFQNNAVVRMLEKDFISIKVDTDREQALSEKFRVRGLPDNWFLAEDGDIVGHRPGYIPAEVFMKILESVAISQTDSR